VTVGGDVQPEDRNEREERHESACSQAPGRAADRHGPEGRVRPSRKSRIRVEGIIPPMKCVAVLGAGLVGSLVARDLAADGRWSVLSVDRSADALGRLAGIPNLSTERADLGDVREVARIAGKADVVVGAVPGFLGTQTVRAALEAGRPVADISFSPEDPFELKPFALAKGIPAIVDCGVSPGLSGLAVGRAAALFDAIDDVRIFVGGLPAARHWPFEYRSVFSPTDVIEEYTRPSRCVEGGEVVVRPALSGVEPLDVPGVGTLEGFYTDGLRTLLDTIKARNLCEKTLRYPGHADRMRMLRETGFFSDEPFVVDGVPVVPRKLTEALLFHTWKRPEGEEELTFLRVVCDGRHGGRKVRRTFELLDRTNRESGDTSMARTTGFPCATAARLLLEGAFTKAGVFPPELLASDDALYARFLAELAERGVAVEETEEELLPG
jgi:saccharopine dehydrogenase-like NADP-dependent oxidoreductase